MKYLFKHKKELIITIALLCVIVYILYDGFKNGREPQSVVESAIMILAWYYNMPTSIEGEIGKIELKQRKSTRNTVYEGAAEPEDASIEDSEVD